MPAGGAGRASPACASTNAPVPSVTLAVPGSQQRRPNSDACWSPTAARTGTPAIVASIASESTIGGSSARGMPNSVEQLVVPVGPPSGHSSERRRCRRRTRGRRPAARSSQRRDVAVGEVLAADLVEHPAQLRRRERRVELEPGALAHHRLVLAQLRAGRVGAPVLPHDRRVHGPAGLALPDHERLGLVRDPERRDVAGPAPAAASAPAIACSAEAAIASGSCSTRPAAGNEEATATDRDAALAQLLVERHAARARRALVEAEDELRSPPHRGVGALGERPAVGLERAAVLALGLGRAARGDPRLPRLDLAHACGPATSRARRPSAPPRGRPRAARGRCAVRASRVRRSSTSSRCSAPSCVHAWTTSARRWPPPPSSGSASSGRSSISARELVAAPRASAVAGAGPRGAAARRASPTRSRYAAAPGATASIRSAAITR